ncbi:phage tail sheath family protein [Corallococcus sp. 4LFB]|uniref:phage tail sheath family protein n=1 Tax=Corallococcus sp. 4LFB TaxID=3383249 RepID=UPI0039759638
MNPLLTTRAPGVYLQPVPEPRSRPGGVLTAFLGDTRAGKPLRLTHWNQLPVELPGAEVCLRGAVRGFFENGGRECWLLPDSSDAPDAERFARWEQCIEELGVDVLGAPTLAWRQDKARLLELQAHLLECCARSGCFALLDSPEGKPAPDPSGLECSSRARRHGALYSPWVSVQDGKALRRVPPCGHVAGVYARVDTRRGLHKAPANEEVHGIVDVADKLTDAEQGPLNARGVNCMRVFRGQGIRLWGARTLSDEPDWRYINVSRLLLSVAKALERLAQETVFEPNDQRLWAWLSRTLNGYLGELFQRGALRGETPQAAFYVRCDSETNPPAEREQGRVLAEVGLAPVIPGEFVVLRLLQDVGGTTVAFTP